MVLSQDIQILCHSRNHRTISWQHLLDFLAILDKEDLDLDRVQGTYDAVIHVQNIEDWKMEAGEDVCLSFIQVLTLGQDRFCSEPIDRLWALLGLLPPEFMATIQQASIIHCSESGKRNYWQAYLAVIKLLHTEDIVDFHWLVWKEISFPKHPSLPSWSPDFNLGRVNERMQQGRTFRSGYVNEEYFGKPKQSSIPQATLSGASDLKSVK